MVNMTIGIKKKIATDCGTNFKKGGKRKMRPRCMELICRPFEDFGHARGRFRFCLYHGHLFLWDQRKDRMEDGPFLHIGLVEGGIKEVLKINRDPIEVYQQIFALTSWIGPSI